LIANFSFGRIGAILISLSIAFSLIGWFGIQAAFSIIFPDKVKFPAESLKIMKKRYNHCYWNNGVRSCFLPHVGKIY